ncbi:tripartite tricarboxylate transporter TctB family protein [Teichococcus oryzae]|jgi:putative tricarboxylic transport membrane protein|uniref:Tripartite tricarboxylate transporter TctB family protein n=1 Tax=Teichococcus oryzae TaxID=1608942 RepID=A0A5B2TFF0_9PROT|nr:tripartite tricarboxylate transporter TctB family protein [Pseudoroseomonas oryzae]KAA2212854.1 tripartite tricarboxylate transporter TctB family protein [Pseudoroseomonas oryzae]
MSDRIVGVLLALFAGWYSWEAGSYAVDFGDPMGPAFFPELLAPPLGLLGLYLVLRPDPEPEWSTGRYLLSQAATVVVLVAYALLLQPMGFILATLLMVTCLTAMLGARLPQALGGGAATSLGAFALFDWLLGIPLPPGIAFGG